MLKKRLKDLLEKNDLAAAAAAVLDDRKAMSHLVRLSYAKDTLVGWRAILAVGRAAQDLVLTDPGFLRETCRKLLWSLSDESGGIGWSAPELLGEIVRADPKLFHDLIPLIASVFDVEEKVFRPGVVYALWKISERSPELVCEHQKIIISSLVDQDAQVRIFGLLLVGTLWFAATATGAWSKAYVDKIHEQVELLRVDHSEAWIYRSEAFESVMVSEVARTLEINKGK